MFRYDLLLIIISSIIVLIYMWYMFKQAKSHTIFKFLYYIGMFICGIELFLFVIRRYDLFMYILISYGIVMIIKNIYQIVTVKINGTIIEQLWKK